MFFKPIDVKKLEEENKNLKADLDYRKDRIKELNRTIEENEKDNKEATEDALRLHNHEIEDLKEEHKHALAEKEFTMKHFKDEEIKKAVDKMNETLSKIAVIENENKYLHQMIDTNAAIIDVKAVLNKIIEKLPNIDIKSLQVTNSVSEK
jgi:RNA processing factor Prp31